MARAPSGWGRTAMLAVVGARQQQQEPGRGERGALAATGGTVSGRQGWGGGECRPRFSNHPQAQPVAAASRVC